MKTRFLSIAAVLLLAACGGSSGGMGSSGSSGSSPQFAAMSVSMFDTTPAPQSMDVKILSTNGQPPPAWATAITTAALSFAPGGNCASTGGVTTCTVQVPAPAGTNVYSITVKDPSNAVLVQITHTQNFSGNQSTPFGAAATGYKVTVSGAALTIGDTTYATSGEPLTVTVKDLSGNTISGAYPSPVTLKDDETTGATALSVNGARPTNTILLNSSTDLATLTYNGNIIRAFKIVASGNSVQGGGAILAFAADVTFPTGVTLDNAGNGGLAGDLNWGRQTVFFAGTGITQQFTAAEVGFTGPPNNKQFNLTLDAVTCGSGASAVASVSGSPATTFSVTSLNPGVCKAKLTEAVTTPLVHAANVAGQPTHDGTFYISVTTAKIGLH